MLAAAMPEVGDELPVCRAAIFMAFAEREVWVAANEFVICIE